MKQGEEFEDVPDDDPDLLENVGLSKLYVDRLRNAHFRRLSDFDGMSYVEMLREPGIGGRIVKAIQAIKEERARQADQ